MDCAIALKKNTLHCQIRRQHNQHVIDSCRRLEPHPGLDCPPDWNLLLTHLSQDRLQPEAIALLSAHRDKCHLLSQSESAQVLAGCTWHLQRGQSQLQLSDFTSQIFFTSNFQYDKNTVQNLLAALLAPHSLLQLSDILMIVANVSCNELLSDIAASALPTLLERAQLSLSMEVQRAMVVLLHNLCKYCPTEKRAFSLAKALGTLTIREVINPSQQDKKRIVSLFTPAKFLLRKWPRVLAKHGFFNVLVLSSDFVNQDNNLVRWGELVVAWAKASPESLQHIIDQNMCFIGLLAQHIRRGTKARDYCFTALTEIANNGAFYCQLFLEVMDCTCQIAITVFVQHESLPALTFVVQVLSHIVQSGIDHPSKHMLVECVLIGLHFLQSAQQSTIAALLEAWIAIAKQRRLSQFCEESIRQADREGVLKKVDSLLHHPSRAISQLSSTFLHLLN